MPPETENYLSTDRSEEDRDVADDNDSDESDFEISEELSARFEKITISSKAPEPLHNIPGKFLNTLDFIEYTHLGAEPWKDDPKYKNIWISPEYKKITEVLAIDCEMVGIGQLQDSELARVSIVNEFGYCVYDTFAKPEEPVTGYRSKKSGVYPKDLILAPPVSQVVKEVRALVRGKILVGHSIHNDLEVLRLHDQPIDTRDTAMFYKQILGTSKTPSLKSLTKQFFNFEIQQNESCGHSSIQDAQATLKLYLKHRDIWESDLKEKRKLANIPGNFGSIASAPIRCITEMSIKPQERDIFVESEGVYLRENQILGKYESSAHYLDVQFRLLLEDLLRPIRYGVKTVRLKGSKQTRIDSLFRDVYIQLPPDVKEYEVKALTTQIRIPVARNKLVDVDWEMSKLFLPGSLLVVSPDNFKSIKFAIVKQRPRDSTQVFNTVKLTVQFCPDGPSWVIDDKTNNFIVMESPAYYEAYRHTLHFLQTVNLDKFPLKRYIVDADTCSRVPKTLIAGAKNNKMDFGVFLGPSHEKRFADPLDLDTWPTKEDLGFDGSQYEAFQKSLTQELSIVQGPPGTGKTFIGVQCVKFFLTNPWLLQNSPIIIVAYTNHALDETLQKIYEFVKEHFCEGNSRKAQHMILRLGGGSKSEVIQPLTVRHKMLINSEIQRLKNSAKQQKRLVDALQKCLQKTGIVNFEKLPLMVTNSLAATAGNVWHKFKRVLQTISSNPYNWFGINDCGLPNFQDLKKKQSAAYKKKKGQQKEINFLLFEYPTLFQSIAAAHPNFMLNVVGQLDARLVDTHLTSNTVNVSDGELTARWAFYFCLLRHLNLIMERAKQELAKIKLQMEDYADYPTVAKSRKMAICMGLTTTGAVKFKKEVCRVKPRVVLVEEAAHVLEANVVASLNENIDRMIMIGDHMQLRPLTADYELSNKYRLNVSLMERLCRNGIKNKVKNYVQLNIQHRMRKEIASLISPVIYRELYNHPSVLQYPNVKGCYKNVFFVDHKNFEAREWGSSSCFNRFEADRVEALVKHFLHHRYYNPSQITVIASYLAQKNFIEKKLKNSLQLEKENCVRVSTIDGYQGEENDIIILSLVRSNAGKKVGFLSNSNRVNVALSRARHGLFMFGNMDCLKASSDIWEEINEILVKMDSIGKSLPLGEQAILSCQHEKTSDSASCKANIITRCSHKVAIPCHMIKGKEPVCGNRCTKIFSCGHNCRLPCHDHDPEQHYSPYRCLEKCQRKCRNFGHPCPGDHDCFAHCSVYNNKGCMKNVRIAYACQHGSGLVPCLEYNPEKKTAFKCPKCAKKIEKPEPTKSSSPKKKQ